MSKEAIVFCIDVSSSMGATDPGKRQTRLKEVMEGVKLLIEAKVLQSKQNECGVVLFGASETANPLNEASGGYDNVSILEGVHRPSVVSLPAKLDQVQVGVEHGDLIDGLVVAVDTLHRRVGKLKFTKTVYLVTAAEDRIESPADLEATVGHMISQEISLVVVGLGFKQTLGSAVTDDVPDDTPESEAAAEAASSSSSCSSAGEGAPQKKDESEAEAALTPSGGEGDVGGHSEEEEEDEEEDVKSGNERMLISIVKATQRGAILNGDDLLAIMTQLQTKSVRPTKSKCVLVLPGGSLEDGVSGGKQGCIDVLVFARAKRTAAPSLKKESKNQFDPLDPTSGTVKTERLYRNPLHPDEPPVAPENIVRGFRYGKDYVPVSESDKQGMKVETPAAALQIIGFVDASDLNPGDSIGDTKCVMAAEDCVRSEAALTALARALAVQGKTVLCRYNGRKNSDPLLVALLPDPETVPTPAASQSAPLQARLLMWQLPFSDDIRGFTFPSFQKAPPSQQPSVEQLAVARALVDALALDPEAFLPERTFNPLRQRLRRATMERVRDSTCQLAEVDPRVRAYMDPCPNRTARALPQIEAFSSSFKFAAVDKNGVDASKKRKHFWSDIGGPATGGDGTGACVAADGGGGGDSKAAAAAAAEAKRTKLLTTGVGSVNPVSDFLAMTEDPSLVSQAVHALQKRCLELITEGATTAYYAKALTCVATLRAASIEHGESEGFNEFLGQLKQRFKDSPTHGEAWEMVRSAKVTLITSSEDGVVDVTAEEAAKFTAEDQDGDEGGDGGDGAAAAPADSVIAGDDDDMFDEMD